jgi:putative transposase
VEKGNAQIETFEESKSGGNRGLKKIKTKLAEMMDYVNQGKVRLMFQDEAGFGRINKPKHCWCEKGIRPSVPCHHIREYRYVYGAVEPLTGEDCFLVMPQSNTVCMNIFLEELSKQYHQDRILLVCDGAAWHKSNTLKIPGNIELFYLPPYTPEMNPIEQIWKRIRLMGFRNEIFATLEKVIERLCDTICKLTPAIIKSITARDWIINSFN